MGFPGEITLWGPKSGFRRRNPQYRFIALPRQSRESCCLREQVLTFSGVLGIPSRDPRCGGPASGHRSQGSPMNMTLGLCDNTPTIPGFDIPHRPSADKTTVPVSSPQAAYLLGKTYASQIEGNYRERKTCTGHSITCISNPPTTTVRTSCFRNRHPVRF